MANSGASAGDPFRFNEWIDVGPPYGIGYSDLSGKTLRSSVIAAPLTTKVIITGGQSNMATACGTLTYTPVSGSADILSIYDGGFYSGQDPVLGCMNGNSGVSSINTRIADSMISRSKATRCIVVPIAIGGTTFAQWVPSASKTLFGRLTAAILRTRARGLEPDAIFWGEGESDNSAGTSAASVKASIWAIVDGIRAAPISCTATFYVGVYTMNSGVNSGPVQTGIGTSVDAGRNIVLGYDADTNLTVAGGFRLSDQTHLSNTGLSTAATGWTTLAFP